MKKQIKQICKFELILILLLYLYISIIMIALLYGMI